MRREWSVYLVIILATVLLGAIGGYFFGISVYRDDPDPWFPRTSYLGTGAAAGGLVGMVVGGLLAAVLALWTSSRRR